MNERTIHRTTKGIHTWHKYMRECIYFNCQLTTNIHNARFRMKYSLAQINVFLSLFKREIKL